MNRRLKMATKKISNQQVYEYYKKRLEAGEMVTLRQAAAHFNVSTSCVNSRLDELVLAKKLHRNTKRIYLREKDVIVKDQRGRHNTNKSIGASKGGKKSSALLKARAEELGIDRNAFSRIPAADDAKLAARIERVVQNAIGEGGGYKQTFIRAGGSKVG